MSNVLVISAHPDDEILGCGGTLIKHSANGDKVYQLFVSDGESSRDIKKSQVKKLINKRKQCAKKSGAIIGAIETYFLDYPDNKLDEVPLLLIIKSIEKIIKKVSPEIIYTHCAQDLNIDHQIVHRAVITACRPLPGKSIKEIYCYEVLSSTEWGLSESQNSFNPNFFVDISKYFKQKLEALKMYKDELKPFPHPRSLEGIRVLGNYRGMNSGFKYAEAFSVKRILK